MNDLGAPIGIMMRTLYLFYTLFLLQGCSDLGTTESQHKPIPTFKEIDFITKDTISDESLKGKVTLIDFWGTWCTPCIDAIPGLVEIHRQYGDRINILSIATDKSQDQDKLKTLIKRHRMAWMHIWTDYDLPKAQRLYSRFEVDVFPTVILLDTNATEIARFNAGFFLESRVKERLAQLKF